MPRPEVPPAPNAVKPTANAQAQPRAPGHEPAERGRPRKRVEAHHTQQRVPGDRREGAGPGGQSGVERGGHRRARSAQSANKREPASPRQKMTIFDDQRFTPLWVPLYSRPRIANNDR